MAVLAAISFTSCSSDDDAADVNPCATCGFDFLGVVLETEYCDNGDGTVTATVEGVEETIDLQGQSFEAFIQAFEAAGVNCN